MTKAQAYYSFMSSFGIPAYEQSAVPQGGSAPVFPYLTYSLYIDSFGTDSPVEVNLWYRDKSGYSSLPDLTRMVEKISAEIGRGGKMIPCDGGALWLRRGSPFAQLLGDGEDELIKRAYINITAESITAD